MSRCHPSITRSESSQTGVSCKTVNDTTALFKAFARRHRWRYKLNESREPIAVARNGHDHLYEGFENHFGVWVERPTKVKLNHLCRYLERMGCHLHQKADLEATFMVRPEKSIGVAKFLRIVKKRPSKWASTSKAVGEFKDYAGIIGKSASIGQPFGEASQ